MMKSLSNWKYICGGDGYSGRIDDGNNNLAFFKAGGNSFLGFDFSTLTRPAYETSKRPIDPWGNDNNDHRTLVPNTYPFVNNPLTNTMFFGFTEVWQRKSREWATSNTNWEDLWEMESDIHNASSPPPAAWQRQITELAIAESDTNRIYLITGGVQNEEGAPWQLPSRLYKSTTGWIYGQQPQEPNFNLIEFPGGSISGDQFPILTGIVVDPVDSNRIWITYTGYLDEYKVWYSDDGGENWSNYNPNGTLNNLPVNAIVYQYGTPDRLYIGTDAGIFTRDANSTDWERYGDFPNVKVVELKINYCTHKLRAATFGRSVWEGDLIDYENQYIKEVNSSLTIDEDLALQGSLKVNEGVTLTIKKLVSVPYGNQIIVESGGELIIDGGTITNACGSVWEGIVVEGNAHEDQDPTSNQGMITIIHEGTIENAKIGIKAIDGGIVMADSANFINNHEVVEFMPYDYENVSQFTFCNFETNEDCLPDAPPDYFVTLTGVDNIEFKACSFVSTYHPEGGDLISRGSGINSTNSNFLVDYECRNATVPCDDYQYNLFEGLYYGINAMDVGYGNSVTVNHTDFSENVKALYLSGFQSGIEVTSNDFDVYSTTSDIYTSYGLYLDHCTGYHIEDNRFHNQSVVNAIPGIYVNNSGTEDNRIYNNVFDTLKYGIVAYNVNRDYSERKGLCIKCNDFTDNIYDIAVTVYGPVNPDLGIAQFQGSMVASDTAPAGNTFSSGGSHEWDIYNEGNAITYVYHKVSSTTKKVKPDDNMISHNVTTQENRNANYDKETSCPSTLYLGGGGKENLMVLFNEAETNIQTTKSALEEVVDGGNTEETNTDVLMSIPNEALEIHDQLLNQSPYLSDTVMKSAIYKEEVLPNAMVRDILVANPQAAKSSDILTKLDNRLDPMPDYMMDEIMAGKDSVGAKEVLDSKLALYQQDRANAFNTLVRWYKNNGEDAWAMDSLIAFLQNNGSIQSKYNIAFLHQLLRDSTMANEVLNDIPEEYDLTDEQQAEHEDYSSLFELYHNLQNAGKSILQLNESQISTLQTLSEDDQFTPGVFARNILLVNKLSDYEEPLVLPDETKLTPINKNFKTNSTLSHHSKLTIYPNPAGKYFIVKYHLEKEINNLQVEILDMTSKKVGEMKLRGEQDQVVIPVNNWHEGIYLVRLIGDGSLIDSQKVTVLNR